MASAKSGKSAAPISPAGRFTTSRVRPWILIASTARKPAAGWGPLTSHFSRLPSADKINAPFFVPTNTRTLLICLCSFACNSLKRFSFENPGKLSYRNLISICALPSAQGDQGAQPWVTQVKSQPQHAAHVGREQDMAKQGVADSKVGHDGATEIAGEKNSAEDGGWRHRVEQRAKQQ